jgi:hypothetical protein
MNDETMSIIEFSEDISAAEAPEPLPAGEYLATIRGAEGKMSQRGTKYGAVTFVIAPEQFPADYPIENAPDGKTIVYRRVGLEDNPNARFMLRKFCEAIGATASKRVDLNEWLGLEAIVHVENEEYEGIPREQIVRVTEA